MTGVYTDCQRRMLALRLDQPSVRFRQIEKEINASHKFTIMYASLVFFPFAVRRCCIRRTTSGKVQKAVVVS